VVCSVAVASATLFCLVFVSMNMLLLLGYQGSSTWAPRSSSTLSLSNCEERFRHQLWCNLELGAWNRVSQFRCAFGALFFWTVHSEGSPRCGKKKTSAHFWLRRDGSQTNLFCGLQWNISWLGKLWSRINKSKATLIEHNILLVGNIYHVQTNFFMQIMQTLIWSFRSISKERGLGGWDGGFAKCDYPI